MNSTANTYPRAWIGSIAAYNAGQLHGRWVDLDCEVAFEEACSEILSSSPVKGEELWAYDTEDLPISGERSPADALRLGLIVEGCPDYPAEAIAHALDHLPADADAHAVNRHLEDAFAGTWESAAEFAEDLVCQTSEIPDHLAHYIDWEKYARDLDCVFIQRDGGGVVAIYTR